ncbi:HAD family hydrolase [uncultured Bartonella sp.]|uniref:HAD family hydrolase n=1 Tax=uncultured Bartonella sp. TaxID=104108 RepID=UPI0025DEA4D2|nr:HAD family hydrolase [uncultured Bartonella sp.]
MTNSKPEMAIAYDFDGTLADGNMQEAQFLPNIGMKPKDFWEEVNQLAKENQGDNVLIYMSRMLRKAEAAEVPVRCEDFKKLGEAVKLFNGVESWFQRINIYGKSKGVDVKHYLLSSGNYEIIAGTAIAKEFTEIYASKFLFDANGVAFSPALAVNYTTKTQYLFRINKGAFDLSDDVKVNQYVNKADRPVPFENMVYIGDGTTDVPCFRLVKDQGGLSIAVYKANKNGAHETASKYIDDGRVQCVLPANYSEGSKLEEVIKANIDVVAARSALKNLLYHKKQPRKARAKKSNQ